jgi:hypothetical protein
MTRYIFGSVSLKYVRLRYESYGRGQGDLAQFMRSQAVPDGIDELQDSGYETGARMGNLSGQIGSSRVSSGGGSSSSSISIRKQSSGDSNSALMQQPVLAAPHPSIAALVVDMCVCQRSIGVINLMSPQWWSSQEASACVVAGHFRC